MGHVEPLELKSLEDFELILKASENEAVFIFKHSVRCPISLRSYKSLVPNWRNKGPKLELYVLDLLARRNLSDVISEKLKVPHESPQLIQIVNGKAVLVFNHFDVLLENVLSAV